MTEKRLQSLAGYLREHLATIERQLSVGVRQEAIVDELAKAGFNTTLKNFRNELCRARKKTPSPPPLTSGGKSADQRPESPKKPQEASEKSPAKSPSNPLKESRGFDYQSSLGVSDSELF